MFRAFLNAVPCLALVALAAVACGSRDAGVPSLTTVAAPLPSTPAAPGPAAPPPGTASPLAATASPLAATASTSPLTASPPADRDATVMPADVASLPARAVCVEERDGTLSPARVQGSIAGVYGPGPLRLAHLNWMAAGIGCVTYPGASTRSAACGAPGTPPAPVVTRTLCQQ